MQKITSILAVVEQSASGIPVLEKAIALARCFHARIELLIADSTLTQEFASRCTALRYDEVTLSSLFRSGEPLHHLLCRHVLERRPDLLIKAPSRGHSLHKWSLHANDRELASECPVPVLLAGPKSWQQPLRVAAAVDVSDHETAIVARGILQAAGFLALGLHGNLDILYSEREERDETLRMERAVKIAQLVREFHVGCERLQMFDGTPEKRLPPLLAARQYDLLVLGAVSHRDGQSFGIEDLSSTLVDATPGDVVLVKASSAVTNASGGRATLVRQQVSQQCEELV
jgi:nucleotide-binding universal stress UspA family protein